MYGTMSSDANYPADAGIPLDGSDSLSGFSMKPFLLSLSVGGTPGTTASYKAQVLLDDVDVTQWVDVKGMLLSGNGAAACGNVARRVIGQAARVVAVNGTSPGTGADLPTYTLDAFPIEETHRTPGLQG